MCNSLQSVQKTTKISVYYKGVSLQDKIERQYQGKKITIKYEKKNI